MRVRIFKTAISAALVGSLLFATALPVSALVRLRTGTLHRTATAPTASAPSATSSGTLSTYSVKFGGITRKYMLYLPKKTAPSTGFPLVFVLHGGDGDMAGMQSEIGWQFERIADKEGFAIVYPDGTSYQDYGMKSSVDGKGHWNDGRNVKGYYSTDKNVDDVGFVSFLIDQASGKTKVDKKRVYVTGFSNGAIMTNRIACELSDKIAAVAPVAGTFATNVAAKCDPSRYVPVLMINGDADPLITWDGSAPTFPGQTLESLGEKIAVTSTIVGWSKIENCSKTKTAAHIDADVTDKTNVDVTKYSKCWGGKDQFQSYVIHWGGHTWPNGNGVLPAKLIGNTTKDFDGGQVIWGFFKDKTLQSANRKSNPGGGVNKLPVTSVPVPPAPVQSCTFNTAYVYNSVRYPASVSGSWGSIFVTTDETGKMTATIKNTGSDYVFVDPGNCERDIGLYRGQSATDVWFNQANATTVYYTNFSCAEKMKKFVSTSWCGKTYDNASY